jgi:hypothetical protein
MVDLCNDTVVLFGGRDDQNRNLNETWVFEIAKLKWKSPRIRVNATSGTIPGMYKHAAVAVRDDDTPCRCKQSMLVIPGPTTIQCSLWELKCLQDDVEYEWHDIIISAQSSNCQQLGYARMVAATDYKNITLMVFGQNGLWAYRHGRSDRKWTRLDTRKITIRKDAAFAFFLPSLESYVVVDSPMSIIRYSLTDGTWVKNEQKIGSFPGLLGMGTVAVFDSYALVYRGQSGTCHQSMFRVTRELDAWLWVRLQNPALTPSFAQQRVLGITRNNLYVIGTPLQWETRANQWKEIVWKLDLQSLQWFQLNSKDIPRGSDKQFACNSVFLPQKDSFVIYRESYPEELYTFYPQEERWTSFTMGDQSPPKRDGYSFVEYNSSSVILFGGSFHEYGRRKKSNTPLNDLWILDFSGMQPRWILLEPNTTNVTNRPEARSQHVAVVIDSCLLIFGGNNGWSELKDMWSYNMSKQSWKLVVPMKSSDPGPTGLSRNWTMTSIGLGHQLLVTVGCTNRLNRETDHCGRETDLQKTWMYCPHAGRWTLLSTTNLLGQLFVYETGQESLQFQDGRLLMVKNQASSVLYSLKLACALGLMSADVVPSLCCPCPIGSYSNSVRDQCIKCPDGLTSESEGSSDISNCTRCVEGYCNHGRCMITQKDHLPAPSCQCYFGFTGDRCHTPNYILPGLALIVTLICLSIVYCINKWRKRQLREGELRRRVEELTSVWQIGHDELRLLDKIGEGGFGRVFRALYREVVVAVKVLADNGQDEQATLEFEREITFMQTVRHSNIVMFIGAGMMDDSSRFLVTEYMHRGSLYDVLQVSKPIGLDISQQVKFAIDAAKGMEFLHGLTPARIHRDLKSFNLLVSKRWVVKVADFGLGRQILMGKKRAFQNTSIMSPLLGNDGLTCTTRVGTVQWRAPELWASERYGTSADVYRYCKLD